MEIEYSNNLFLWSRSSNWYGLSESVFFTKQEMTIPVDVNLNRDLITLIIQLSIVTLDSTGVLIGTNNFGLHTGYYVKQVKVSSHIGKFKTSDGNPEFLRVVSEKCEISPGVWLCGQHAFDYSQDSMFYVPQIIIIS